MLIRPARGVFLIASLLAVSCSSEGAAAPTPSTVAEAAPVEVGGIPTVNVGMILNSAAPTASRDTRLAQVLDRAARSSTADVALEIETLTIDDVASVPSAVNALVQNGVTVIATSCDDSTMPEVVAATVDAGILAVTGCVTLPRPELDLRSRLFIDLAGLSDTPAAMMNWARAAGHEQIAVLGSELIPDVSSTCAGIEAAASRNDLSVVLSTTFTELLDNPAEVVEAIDERLGAADVIVICALTPSLGDLVIAVRNAGHQQPIAIPWFGDPQEWPGSINDVFVLAPASRYGDDPSTPVAKLFSQLDQPEAVDIVAADTLAILADAADRAGSVGSRRIADAMREGTTSAISGTISIDRGSDAAVGREYRVIEIVAGTPTFAGLVAGNAS